MLVVLESSCTRTVNQNIGVTQVWIRPVQIVQVQCVTVFATWTYWCATGTCSMVCKRHWTKERTDYTHSVHNSLCRMTKMVPFVTVGATYFRAAIKPVKLWKVQHGTQMPSRHKVLRDSGRDQHTWRALTGYLKKISVSYKAMSGASWCRSCWIVHSNKAPFNMTRTVEKNH